jgi:hypothetical protein
MTGVLRHHVLQSAVFQPKKQASLQPCWRSRIVGAERVLRRCCCLRFPLCIHVSFMHSARLNLLTAITCAHNITVPLYF